MKKQTVPWLFAVLLLSFLLVISVALGLTGYYFGVAYINSNSDIVVGDFVNISVLPNQSNVASFTFDGAYLSNEVVPQVIQINADDLNVDVRVRVRAKVFGETKSGEVDFVTTEHFERANDGYFYYNEILKGGNKTTFCNYIVMPKEQEFLGREKYILTIVVEALDSNVENIWKIADN